MPVRAKSRAGPAESPGRSVEPVGLADWHDGETESADLGGGATATWLPGKVGHPQPQRCFAAIQAEEGTLGSFLSRKREQGK